MYESGKDFRARMAEYRKKQAKKEKESKKWVG